MQSYSHEWLKGSRNYRKAQHDLRKDRGTVACHYHSPKKPSGELGSLAQKCRTDSGRACYSSAGDRASPSWSDGANPSDSHAPANVLSTAVPKSSR